MRIALAQCNPIVGDIEGNTARIIAMIADAERAGAHLVIFPELVVTGYPPKDLLLRQHFVKRNVAAIEQIAQACRTVTAVVGFARPNPGEGKPLHNAAAICTNGHVLKSHGKLLLPTYDVFDETRYFAPDSTSDLTTLELGGKSWRVGFSICEDLWNDAQFDGRRLYAADPIAALVRAGAELLVNVSASPFTVGKQAERIRIFGRQIAAHGVPLAYVNQVGGNDELIFDGGSAYFTADGKLAAQAKLFEEDLLLVDTDHPQDSRREPLPEDIASIGEALVLGTRDYVRKCGFREVVIGLSGGIDSAVAAALAVRALGAEHVHGVAMPSRFSSTHSVEDAAELARGLGIDFRIIPITGLHAAAEEALAPHFAGRPVDVTEENIQARARGQILMALSNKFGWMLLTTGNKSELAVGYCTLYGDMCGGLAVISDVPKMHVYALGRWINEQAGKPLIPERTFTKPPSAELRENQTDQDSLPPYPVLDAILKRYVEEEQSADEIAAAGFDRATVVGVIRMVDGSEYKRKQAATGLKVTSRAFGIGRRLPIASRHSL